MFFQKKQGETTEEITEIDETKLPKHIAIIMDGNGRWAAKRGIQRSAGHKAGAEALEKVIEAARQMGIGYLTVYAFSTENWKRSEEEVGAIMGILRFYLKNYFSRFLKDNLRLKVIGDVTGLEKDIQEQIKDIEERSKEKDGMVVQIALNYGGRDELCRGFQKIAEEVKAGRLQPEAISEEIIANALDTAGGPDPELMIRTSAEERISNFLLWQIAYTEFYFTDLLWPDFDEAALKKAVVYYQNRDRRFGGR